MFGLDKKKEKEVKITALSEFVMWDMDVSNIAYDATLYIDSGCLGVYIVNGQLKWINAEGRYNINPKKEKRENNRLQLIGVCANKTFEILCGVGDIPFKDWELNVSTEVGAHGNCRVSIANPWILYTKLGKKNITREDIDTYIRTELIALMRSDVAGCLQNADYITVTAGIETISEQLSKKFAERFLALGLYLEKFVLLEIHFKEEYKAARKRIEDEEADRKKEREKERKQRKEIEIIKELSEIGTTETKSPKDEIYCRKCGKKIAKEVRFCPYCGKKLS